MPSPQIKVIRVRNLSSSGGGTPGGSDTQGQFNNAGAFGGATNLTYDLTQLPGSGSSTHAVTIGPPESTLDPSVRGSWDPVHTLITSDVNGGSGYSTALGVEAYSNSGYLLGMGIQVKGNPLADTTDDITGQAIDVVTAGTKNVGVVSGQQIAMNVGNSGGTAIDLYGEQISLSGASGIAVDAWGIRIIGPHNLATGRNTGIAIESQGTGANDAAIHVFDGKCILDGDFRLTSPTVPNAANAAGVAGTIAWDTGFIYVCVATNTWKRVAIATW